MKSMKLSWGGTLALASLMALGSMSQAQDKKDEKPAAPATPAAPAVRPGTPPAGRPMDKAARVEAQLRSYTMRLSLTDDQKAKIKPLIEEEVKKFEEVQQDRNLPPDERRKKFMEAREATMAKLKPLLTPEQQQKLESRPRARRPEPAPTSPAPAAPAPTAPAPAK